MTQRSEVEGFNETLFTNGSDDKVTTAEFTLHDDAILRICLYSVIFVFAVTGNSLVIITLAQNKRMRTVTNVFLLNLAVSDILLGVFCMPFTLVGSLLRNFVFGETMCRLIPYLQAVSVSVSVWTLVAISLERFFAICSPLQSRRWQTISHAYRVIALVWLGSLLTMLPIALLTRLLPLSIPGRHKCREVWPDITSERIFNIYLDIILMVIPLIIMVLVYSLITRTLYLGIQVKTKATPVRCLSNETIKLQPFRTEKKEVLVVGTHNDYQSCAVTAPRPRRNKVPRQLVVRGNYEKCQAAKRRVICMLSVVVVEFFICWSPLYVVNTWTLYDRSAVYRKLGYGGISIIQLLAYVSSCCNPITYCFLQKKFRKAFAAAVVCRNHERKRSARWSEKSATMNSICSIHGSFRAQSAAV